MEIKAIGIRTVGGEGAEKTDVVVEIQLPDGSYYEFGRETLYGKMDGSFSNWWNVDAERITPIARSDISLERKGSGGA